MATIDLGKIKIVWRGTYAGGTAYTPDDAVVLNGTSYICIANTTGNSPPNATYWNVLAQGGTDLGATLSNNQIAIKNNSGNIAGVSIGNAGEFLKVSSGATGYEFGAAGGGKINQVLQMEYENSQSFSASSGTFTDTAVTLNITPTATNSKIIGWAFYNCGVGSDVFMYLRISRTAPSSAVVCNRVGHSPQSGCALIDAGSMHFIDSPNTTSQCTYTLQLDAGGGTAKLNDRGDGSSGAGTSGIMLMEVLA
tara:strand:- start:164 stop:916 length:753 start_codon:yes stop_codon:yes gene_type:complete